MRIAITLLVLSALHPAAAQLTEKQAVAQLKAASKAQLKSFKQNCAAALTALDAGLDTVDALITESSDAEELGSLVAGHALLYVSSLNDDFALAKGLADSAASLALVALADGGSLAGLYPEDFSYGTGGVLDKHRAALRLAGLKSRDAAHKRLAKTATLAEKKANIAITFHLPFPTRLEVTSVNEPGNLGLGQGSTLDVLLACSDLDTTGDGLLVVAGVTSDSINDVTVGYFRGLGESGSDTAEPEAVSGRFVVVFTSLDEGGYVVNAKQGSGGSYHGVGEIGLR